MNTDYYYKALEKQCPIEFFELLKKNNCYLAGGAILSIVTKKEINDLDIYFKTKKDAINFYYDCVDINYHCINETSRSLILVNKNNNKLNINMIIFDWFDAPEDIFNLFDFTICQSAFDGKNFYFSKDYFKDVMSRSLFYNKNTRYPVSSLLRLKKYFKKGYKISRNQFLKMCLNVSNRNIETYEQLESEIGGVYGIELDKIMPDLKDNFSLDKFINDIDNIDVEFEEQIIKVKDIDVPNFIKKEYPILEIRDRFIEIYEKTEIEEENINENSNIIKYPIYVYKYVDENLVSFYDKKVKYEIGELLEDENEHGFNVLLKKDEYHFYKNKKGSKQIKLMILSKNDIYYYGKELVVSKCIPVEVIETECSRKNEC